MQFSLHEATHAPHQFVALIPKIWTRAYSRLVEGALVARPKTLADPGAIPTSSK